MKMILETKKMQKDYKNAHFEKKKKKMERERKIIQSKSHKLRKFEVNIISLSAHNDKRYILDDGIKILVY